MNIEIYQWLVPFIGIVFIGRVIYQFLHQRRTLHSLIIWTIFWLIVMVVAALPNPISIKIASLLGFKDNVNAIIFVGLGLLFFMVFYLSNSLQRIERKLTVLVRELALEQQKNKELEEQNATKDKA